MKTVLDTMRKLLNIIWLSIIFLSLRTVEPARRIYGGRSIEPGELPFVVRLEVFDDDILEQLHCCSGSLIKPEWVLTAAHCEVCTKLKDLRLRYGHIDARWNASDTYSKYIRMVQHPGYRADPYKMHQGEKLNDELLRHFIYQNDIALFEMETVPLSLGAVSPIDFKTVIGKEVTAAGYGIMALRPIIVDNTLALSQPLQKAVLMVKECERSLVLNSFPILCVTHKCSKGSEGEAIMPGDSGGPLVFNGKIVGVCSYGFHALHGKDMILKETGFYTAVSPYLDWIKSITEPDHE